MLEWGRHGRRAKPPAMKKPAALLFELEEPERKSSAKMLTKDEARRIAVNIAKLLELLQKQ
jgi:hypothetical protein